MQKATFVQSDFSRGELSRRLDGRFDIPFYYQGASKLRNMITMPQGGVTRMPGTIYMGQAKYADKPCRLIPFQPNAAEKYILEVGEQYIRIWNKNGLLLNGGNPVELYANYYSSELSGITYAQSKNILFLAHPFKSVYRIQKQGDQFQTRLFTFLTNNWNASTKYKPGDKVFYNGHYYVALIENTGTAPVPNRYWELRANLASYIGFEVWNAGVVYPKGSQVLFYNPVDNKTGIYQANINVPAGVCPTCPWPESAGLRPKTFIWIQVGEIYGNINEIPAWQSDYNYQPGDVCVASYNLYQANAANTNVNPLDEPRVWELGTGDQYAASLISITFMDRRLILAGSLEAPQTIWGSKIEHYDDLTIGTNDSDAFRFTISSDREGIIQWSIAQDNLLIGTTNGEYLVTGGGRPITPTNVQVLRQSSYGSAPVRAIVAGDSVLFVQKGGRKVREFVYSDDKKTYQAPDLTLFADHVTESGIVQWDYQQSPHPIVWAVLANGNLLGLTYDRISNVWGWHVHETDGAYESICVQDGESGEDEVWVVVRRTVNGQPVRYIEKFAPFEFEDIQNAHFVHSGVYYPPATAISISYISQGLPAMVTCPSHGLLNGDRIRITEVQGMEQINNRIYTVANATTNSFTLKNEAGFADVDSSGFDAYTGGGVVQKVVNQFFGLSHLSGKQVFALADGATYENLTVSSQGVVTMPNWVSWARIGLPYTAMVKSMRLGKGELKRINKLRILFYKTIGCEFGPEEEDLRDLDWRQAGEDPSKPPQLYTGYKEAFLSSTYDREPYIVLQNQKPLPFTVLSIQAEARLYD